MQNGNTPASSGGGVREVGTVTAGMAVMNFDAKTKPYTRQDLIEFLSNYEKNLNEQELRLVEKGIFGTFVGMPLFFAVGYTLAGRLGWDRVVRAMAPVPEAASAAPAASSPAASPAATTQKPFVASTKLSPASAAAANADKWARRIPLFGRVVFGLAAATIPYIVVQQWFISKVLDMDERESALSFNVRRLMIAQRSGMMFKRTATREVTRDEQDRLMREAEAHASENRSGTRVDQGLGAGPTDVNLRLGGQALTPVAQSGYKPMIK